MAVMSVALRQCVGVIVILLWVCASAWAESLPLTLSQAIERALAENRQFKAEAQALEGAKGDRLSTFRRVLPTLETSAFYRWNLKKNVIFFPNAATATITAIELGKDKTVDFRAQVTQPIFDFGGMAFAMKAAGLAVTAERAALDDARHDLVYRTTVAYYRVHALDQNAKLERRLLAQAEESVRVVTAKQRAEIASEYEVLDAQADVDRHRVASLNADHRLIEARNELGTLLYLDPGVSLQLTESMALPPAPPSLDTLLEQATAQNPFLRELRLSSKALKTSWRSKQTTWGPRLDGQLNYALQGESDDAFPMDDEFVTSKSVALVASFPVFDGLQREGDIKKAKAAYLKSIYELENSLRDFHDAFAKAYHSLVASRLQVEAERKSERAAAAAQREARARHAGGLITALELKDAELGAELAQVRILEAEWNAASAAAYLDRLIGGPYDQQ